MLRLASPWALCVAAAGMASAQTPTVLYTFTGSAPVQNFACAVASAGDVDADGSPDVIVGAFGDDTLGTDTGAAFVYSGATGARLLSWLGDAPGDGFGISVAGAGDVNGDGQADLLVGEYRHDGVGANSGRARVHSGADGAPLWVLDGTAVDHEFGIGVSGIGDLDGDGLADFGVGAHHDDANGPHSGSVRVVSGATGGQLYLLTGSAGDDLGHVLAGLGDIDGDAVPDLIVGLHDTLQPGQARIYSGASGAVLFNFVGNSNGDFFGHAVAGAGDVDGDGVPDMLIGASQDDTAFPTAGRAWLRSGATGAVLYDWTGDATQDGFGASVSGAGDWDGDGVRDALIGIPGADPGGPGSTASRVYSGADGGALYTYAGTSPGLRFDAQVADLGDVNGDGRPDVIIGMQYHDQAATDAGLAVVLSGAQPTWAALGGGLAGVDGIPVLSGQGLLAAGTPGALSLQHAAPLAPALLFVSLASMPVPFKGGQLAAFPILVQIPLATSAAGSLNLPWAAWPPGVPPATQLWFQCVVLDAAATQGVALSSLLAGTAK